MYNIGDYLKKFSLVIGSESRKKQAIIDEIKRCVGVDISKDAITIKDMSVFVTASPITKNTLFIKKRMIIQALETAGYHIADIR